MASENVLTVSLKEYKKSIEDLRGSLLGLDEASEEYKKISEEIASKQSKLNEVMTVGKKTYEGSENSLNGMKSKLAELRKEFDKTDVGTDKWKALQKEINETTNKIKNVEEGIQLFGRNVGNYTNSFVTAFSSMGGAAAKIAGPVGSATNAMKLFNTTNPVGWIALAVNAIASLTNMFSKNEGTTQRLNKAFAVFRPVVDMLTNSFQKLADGLSKVVDWFSEAAEWVFSWIIPGYEEAVKKAKDLAKAQNDFDEQKRENLQKQAELENEIAKYEEQVSDSELSVDDRIAAQKKLLDARKELLNIKKAELETELKILEAEADRGTNSKEDNDRIAQIKAALTAIAGEESKVQTAHNKTIKRLNNEAKQQEKERVKAAQDAAKEKQRLRNEEIKAEQEKAKQIKEANENAAYENLKMQKDLAEQGTEEYVAAAKRLEEYEHNQRVEKAKSTIADEKILNEQLELLEKQHLKTIAEIQAEKDNADKERLKNKLEEEKLNKENELAKIGLNEGTDSKSYILAEQQQINDELAALRLEDFENAALYNQKKIELETKLKNTVSKLNDLEEKENKKKYETWNNGLSATQNLLGNVATAYQQLIETQLKNGEISQEEAEKQFEIIKGVQYANTIINTLSGMMGIWANGGNPYVNAAMSAALLIQGLANAQQIANQTIGTTSSASSSSNNIATAVVSATPILNEEQDTLSMQTTSYVTNQEEGTQKVVIVESDIQESNNRVKVRENNTTF